MTTKMAFDTELYRAVERELEAIRKENESDLARRRMAVFTKVPKIEELDDEIKSLGLKLYKIALDGGDVQDKITKLRASQKALLQEREALLLENGFAPDELSIRYRCAKCKDTGTVGTANCDCYKKKLILKAYEESNLSGMLEDQSFATFDLSVYPDEVGEYGMSPRENMEVLLGRAKTYASEFEKQKKSLLFWGDPGLGKTFLSTCIAKALLKNGYSVIYETAYSTFTMLEDLKFNKSDNAEKLRFKVDKLYQCDFLILDDLGSEFATQYTTSALFDIVNSRLISGKKTLINTNLSIDELMHKYTERVASRIIGHYTMYEFFGDDIRLKKSDVSGS